MRGRGRPWWQVVLSSRGTIGLGVLGEGDLVLKTVEKGIEDEVLVEKTGGTMAI